MPELSRSKRKRRVQRSAVKKRAAAVQRSSMRKLGRKSWDFHGLRSEISNEMQKPLDMPLILITGMLLIIGLISLLSASYPQSYYKENISTYYYFIRQLIMAVIGTVAMIGSSCIPYQKYKEHSWGLYVISVILLILVRTPLGTTVNNAQRWLFGFQPSEVAKLALIAMFAAVASRNPQSVKAIRGLWRYVILLGVLVILLALEPHMSAAMIMCVVGFTILFVAGMHMWFMIPLTIVGVIGSIGSYFAFSHIRARVKVFLDPFLDATGTGWQAVQSHIAIGSGGLLGLGAGQSRQKFMYLPEPMNDFIFSVICEEIGFIGAVLIMMLFAYFIYRGFSIARRSPDRFSCLVATGITMQFAFQILLNLAVVTGLFPVTGASLPLFSYGGTALLMQMFEIGILLNISRNIPPSRKQ